MDAITLVQNKKKTRRAQRRKERQVSKITAKNSKLEIRNSKQFQMIKDEKHNVPNDFWDSFRI